MFLNQPIFRRLVIIFSLLIAVFSVVSCKKKEEAPAPRPVAENRAAPSPPEHATAHKGEAVPQEKKRKVILNHSINLEVKEFPVALEALTKLAETSGGYVFKSKSNSQDKKYQWGEVGIRVPASKAGSVLTSVRGLGRVDNENSTAEDITEGYVDLEARLKNAKSSEARLLELNRKASKLTDILEVEKEITRVRGDIEALEAKKNNWDLLTEMVTIEVSMHEASGGFPSFNRLWSLIKNGVGSAVEGLIDSLSFLIIFLGAVLPWVAVFGPLAYLFAQYRRRFLQGKSLLRPRDENQNRESGSGDLQ